MGILIIVNEIWISASELIDTNKKLAIISIKYLETFENCMVKMRIGYLLLKAFYPKNESYQDLPGELLPDFSIAKTRERLFFLPLKVGDFWRYR